MLGFMDSITIAELDARLWDIHRLMRAGHIDQARVETTLLLTDAQSAGNDWVVDELESLWSSRRVARSA